MPFGQCYLFRLLLIHVVVVQADEMIAIYVPFCQGKMASEELLASHRSYLAVS